MALWTPAEIASDLWVEADADSPFADMSGSGRDFTAVSGQPLPTIEPDVVNGRDVFRFNGTDQIMESATELDIRDAHVFIIARGATETSERISSHRTDNSSTDRWYTWNDRFTWGAASITFGASANWHVFESIASGDNKEGLRTANSDGTTTDSNAKTHSHIRIGGGNTSAALTFGECDVYAVLKVPLSTSAADIERIQGYFAHRIGVESDLPEGHPYKTEAPTITVEALATADSPLGNASTLISVPADAIARADSPLGDAAALGTIQIDITSSADSPLGDAFVLVESPLLAYSSADSPLGDAETLVSVEVAVTASADSPLGNATVLGHVPASIIARADSPLGSPRAYLINDWTATVPIDSQIYYVAELQHQGESLRMSISSWQATIQTGRSSFLQAVVPGAGSIIDDIAALAAGDLVIYRGARRLDGSTSEMEMARVPLGQMPANRGPGRLSATLSGYGKIEFQEMGEAEGNKRTLTGVRSLSTQGGTRARTNIDWLLRPGMTALAAGEEFNVSYINYYVNVAQAFMDVGERSL